MAFFFFSSRRRHTRLQGDWSSDVCSSDLIVFCALSSICISAQTSAFTYQGRLTDTGTQPTATYDMEFRLFDASEGGNPLPLGNPITITFTDPPRGVSVANGVFTVQLDFGGAAA